MYTCIYIYGGPGYCVYPALCIVPPPLASTGDAMMTRGGAIRLILLPYPPKSGQPRSFGGLKLKVLCSD